jgi:hypothetical protein
MWLSRWLCKSAVGFVRSWAVGLSSSVPNPQPLCLRRGGKPGISFHVVVGPVGACSPASFGTGRYSSRVCAYLMAYGCYTAPALPPPVCRCWLCGVLAAAAVAWVCVSVGGACGRLAAGVAWLAWRPWLAVAVWSAVACHRERPVW